MRIIRIQEKKNQTNTKQNRGRGKGKSKLDLVPNPMASAAEQFQPHKPS